MDASQSVVGAMNFHVFVVGDWVNQAKDVLTFVRIETIDDYGIGGAIFTAQLQLGIAYDDFALIGDAKLGTYLQNNSHFVACGHDASLGGC
jgi:hypothetical protein